mgnify:CR=1 FL=1
MSLFFVLAFYFIKAALFLENQITKIVEKHIPARIVDEKNYQVEEKEEKEFPIAKASKIIYYAEKYRIPFNKFGFKKTFKELSKDIREYERKYLKRILSSGEDNKYDEYGMYIRRI